MAAHIAHDYEHEHDHDNGHGHDCDRFAGTDLVMIGIRSMTLRAISG